MKNELRIKPLLQYEILLRSFENGREEVVKDEFTADGYDVQTNKDGNFVRIQFHRTGNTIRDYYDKPIKIIVTPVDEA